MIFNLNTSRIISSFIIRISVLLFEVRVNGELPLFLVDYIH